MYARTARDIGLILRDRRRSLHLTQAQLAERAGVSRPTVVRIETGRERAELGVVLRLLAAAGLSVNLAPPPPPEIDLQEVLARTRQGE